MKKYTLAIFILMVLIVFFLATAKAQPGDPGGDPDKDTVKVSKPKLSFAISKIKKQKPKRTFKRKLILFSAFTVTAILLTKKEEKE